MNDRNTETGRTELSEILRQTLAGLAPTHGFSALIDRMERTS